MTEVQIFSEEYLTTKEVQQQYKVSRGTIYRRISEKIWIPYRFANARAIYFKKSEIESTIQRVHAIAA